MTRTYSPGFVDVAWLDAHLAAERVDDSGAVGADETGLGLALEGVHDLSRTVSNVRRVIAGDKTRTRISSAWGIPSVMQTMSPISFSMASIMASAAVGGGT